MNNTNTIKETQRQMHICNACRYCEGLCPVFPTITKYREFNEHTLHYLANLCHNCQACYHGCQYTSPHEFNINIPQVFNAVRNDTFTQFTTPAQFAKFFMYSARTGFILTALCITLLFILAIFFTGNLWSVPAPEESFFKIIPLWLMSGIPIVISIFVIISIMTSIIKFKNFIVIEKSKKPLITIGKTLSNILTLSHLNGSKHKAGCYSYSNTRGFLFKTFHFFVFYGFALCFLATSVASYYHYILGITAPYDYNSAPVILGSIGGIMLIIGTVGILYLKKVSHKVMHNTMQSLEYTFIYLLLFVALTGMILLITRETIWMAFWLSVHLGFVFSLFLVVPYSKFMHSIYRFLAILKYHSRA